MYINSCDDPRIGPLVTTWDDDGEPLAWPIQRRIFWPSNNPDVSVSDNSIGRLWENSAESTARDVAQDFSRYLKSQGVDYLTKNRLLNILKSPGWSPFFDPFSSRSDGSSIAFRSSWEDAWEVFHNKLAKRWEVRILEKFDPSIHDGWKVIIPHLYKSYVEICTGARRPISKEAYGVNWLSEGFGNLQQHIPAMAVFSGHRERDKWLGLFGSLEIASNWLFAGVSASDAKKFADLHLAPEDVSIIKRNYPNQISSLDSWIKNDFEISVIKKNIRLSVSIEVALSWRGSEYISDESVADWINEGFNNLDDAVEWKKQGFHEFFAGEWLKNGFESATEASEWMALVGSATLSKRVKECGCSINQENQLSFLQHNPTGTKLDNFRQLSGKYLLGVVNIEDVFNDISISEVTFEASLAWRSAGFTLDEHIFWVGLGVDLYHALPWLNSGFDLREYISWRAVNINVNTAGRYKKLGYGPRQSKSLIEQKMSPTRAVQEGIEPIGL